MKMIQNRGGKVNEIRLVKIMEISERKAIDKKYHIMGLKNARCEM